MTEPPAIVSEVVTKVKVNPDWLRWKRQQAGVSQATLARSLGVHRSHINNMERGLTVCSARAKEAYMELGTNHEY